MAHTNTLHVVTSAGVDLTAVGALARRFGEVASVSAHPTEPDLTEITYFDVRAAQCAQELFSTMYPQCLFGPQKGDRTAIVSGDEGLQNERVHLISGIYYREDVWDGGYTLEFYDVREAEHFRRSRNAIVHGGCSRAETPSPPPGLASGLESPPGLEPSEDDDIHVKSAWCGVGSSFQRKEATSSRVQLTGLHPHLLNDDMVEAIIEQAGLEDALVSVEIDDASGAVEIAFATLRAAQQLSTHVRSCCWARHSHVSAEVFHSDDLSTSMRPGLLHSPASWPVASCRSLESEPMTMQLNLQLSPSSKVGGKHGALDSYTPAYVQAPRFSMVVNEDVPAEEATWAVQSISAKPLSKCVLEPSWPLTQAASDVSTEVGETAGSEVEVQCEEA